MRVVFDKGPYPMHLTVSDPEFKTLPATTQLILDCVFFSFMSNTTEAVYLRYPKEAASRERLEIHLVVPGNQLKHFVPGSYAVPNDLLNLSKTICR